jgi:hypothetical protein
VVRERRTASRMPATRRTEEDPRIESLARRCRQTATSEMRHELLNAEDLDGAKSLQYGGTRRRFAAGPFGMSLLSTRVRDSTAVAFVMIARCDRVRHAVMVRRPSMGRLLADHKIAGAVTHRSGPGRHDHEEDQRHDETSSPPQRRGSALRSLTGQWVRTHLLDAPRNADPPVKPGNQTADLTN